MVTAGFFFSGDAITFVRSFVQKSSTSDGMSKSSLTSDRPFCTSRFCTSTASDAVLITAVASCFTMSARPSSAFSTNTFTCADARSLPFSCAAILSSL